MCRRLRHFWGRGRSKEANKFSRHSRHAVATNEEEKTIGGQLEELMAEREVHANNRMECKEPAGNIPRLIGGVDNEENAVGFRDVAVP
jgi:hypothetical protein